MAVVRMTAGSVAESTVNFLGSQKLFVADGAGEVAALLKFCGAGEGEGEREGQEMLAESSESETEIDAPAGGLISTKPTPES